MGEDGARGLGLIVGFSRWRGCYPASCADIHHREGDLIIVPPSPPPGPTMRSKGHSTLHSPRNQYVHKPQINALQFRSLASTWYEIEILQHHYETHSWRKNKIEDFVVNSVPHPPTLKVYDFLKKGRKYIAQNYPRFNINNKNLVLKFKTLDPHSPTVKDRILKRIMGCLS